jgi:prolyl oligopeptidase
MMNQNLKKLFLFSLLFMSLHNATSNSSIAQDVVWKYPSAKKIEQVDDYFGQKVADPYRWLENDVREDNEVANWVEKQNKLTFGYLKDLPYREKIEGRITELWNYEKYGLPRKAGDKYYYSKNDGLQNQSVVYQMDSLNGDPSVLLDPNKWSADGTIALAGMTFSDDGKFMAYGVQDGGSDWRTWKVMNALTGEILNDELNWIKFSGVSWSADNKGFFYGRYDEPEEGAKFQSLNKNMKVYYHLVGTKQSADKLIHSDSANPDWGFQTSATEDGKYLVVTIWKGTANKYRVNYKDLSDDANPIKELITTFDNEFSFIGNRDSWFYFLSDWKAPKKSVIAIDVTWIQEKARLSDALRSRLIRRTMSSAKSSMKARTVQKFQCLSLIVVTLNWMVPTLLCYTRTGGSVFPSHPVFQLVAFNGWRWAEYLQCPIFEVVGNTASHGILQERKLKNKTCLTILLPQQNI